MTTLVGTTPGRVPVTPDEWKYYGEKDACLIVFGRVKNLCPDAEMYDGISEVGGDQQYDGPTNDRVWKVKGSMEVTRTVQNGNGPVESQKVTLFVQEFLGWLVDRSEIPSSDDPNGMGPLGGPYLVVRDVGATDAQGREIGELHWSQTPQGAL